MRSSGVMGEGRRRFRYVDFAAAAQPGFRNRLVAIDEVPALVDHYGADECYASIFLFSDDVLLYLAEHRVEGRPSIAGYDGKVWSPFLPLDLDGHPPAAGLADALDLARRTYRLLTSQWELPEAALHVFFSGAKGVHLLIDTRTFGRVTPAKDLPRVYSRLRLELLRALPDAALPLFDLSIGDKARLLRLPNTRHRGSGCYKIALTSEELFRAPAAEVRALARTPRPLGRLAAAGLLPVEAVAAVPGMVERFRHARRTVRRARGPHPYRLAQAPAAAEDALCAARRAMWQLQIAPGNRNNVAIRLASIFRLAGFARERTAEFMGHWNRRQETPLPQRELESVIHSAYARPYPYTYSCHDEVVRAFCPYAGRLSECDDYREQHPRSARRA